MTRLQCENCHENSLFLQGHWGHNYLVWLCPACVKALDRLAQAIGEAKYENGQWQTEREIEQFS